MSSVNDLCRRLDIRHPLEQSTCIGYGQRKPTCGCAVAESSRLTALAKLESVNDNLNSGARVSSEALRGIASLLLCKRWHQSQADENVQHWRRNLREISATPARIPLPTPPSTNVTPAQLVPAPRNVPAPRPSPESFSDQQLVQEIKRRLQQRRSDELLGGILEIANTVLENHNNTRDQTQDDRPRGNPRTNVDEASRPNPPRSPITPPPSYTNTAGNSSRTYVGQSSQNRSATVNMATPNTQTPVSRPAPASESVRQARIAALTPVVSSSRPEPPARSPSPLRQSHLECVVCTLPYEEDTDEYWECRSCLNRVHMQCFENWRDSQLPGRVTCIHCRGQVSEGRAA